MFYRMYGLVGPAAVNSVAAFSVLTLQSNRTGASKPSACEQSQKITPVRIMTFNVQFYVQFSRVLSELNQLQIRYGPFKHKGFIQSLDGNSLDELTKEGVDLEAYKTKPAIKSNFEAICMFMKSHRPDVLAVQEGIKGMDITAEKGPMPPSDAGYNLQTVISADGQTCKIPRGGTMVNQIALNVANPALAAVSSWQIKTKAGSDTDEEDVARCAAGLRVNISGQPLDIVSTHLTGGRYDDRRWRQYRTQRLDEVCHIIDSKFDPDVPMMILGDFNAPSTQEEVNEEYGRILGVASDEDMAVYKEYMVGVHAKLRELGWKPAYSKNDLSIPSSAFGATVDWVFLSPNWPESLKVVGVHVVDVIHASEASWASYPAGGSLKLSLSDHNPVVLDIHLCQ
eukprot:TRINITY_DN32958_c0_g1_i1.p1 TRINITY_DN32958_c0_g1~~TRINITY_DN32958_c0_g1_i1.p1  ORF type:complete len:396 (+),score=51.55 TRINITY_DN32958_c0_g1_i1:57-1244(+)